MKKCAWIFILSLCFCLQLSTQTQPEDETPYGDAIVGVQKFTTESGTITYVWTQKGCYRGTEDAGPAFIKWEKVFPKPGTLGAELFTNDIAGGFFKVYSWLKAEFCIYTKTGRIFSIDPISGKIQEFNPPAQKDPYDMFKKFEGDAVYALSSAQFLVSRDTMKTWQADTAGLAGSLPKSFDIDSLQYIYIAHTNGVYKQHQDSMVWNKITSFPGTSPTIIFIDRKQRILVNSSSNKRTYISTNGGGTRAIDTAGMSSEYVQVFGDDVYGNLFAISGDYKKLYRSLGGTQPWTRIDKPVTDLMADPSAYDGYSNLALRTVGGDSVLFLGTAFGLFYSKDQGSTWQPADNGLPSKNVYGYLKTKSGRTIQATNLGTFYRTAYGQPWVKSYPQTGHYVYTGNRLGSLFTDAAGNIYTLGLRRATTDLTSPQTPLKSTDEGATWVPDTAGFSSVGNGYNFQYFVDETGTQYLASYSMTGALAVKKPGQSWVIDSTGFVRGAANRSVIAFQSDKKGYIYVSTIAGNKALLLKRPIAGGTWEPDSTGLMGDVMYAMTNDRLGNLYASGLTVGMVKKSGSGWTQVPLPSELPGCSAFGFSVDSSNALFAIFGDYFNWRGVYFTTNGGTSWSYSGFDKMAMRLMKSYGDTTYALTSVAGIYKLTRTPASIAGKGPFFTGTYQLFNNFPNPFNPATTIAFVIQSASHVKLSIYDILGREVRILVNEKKETGTYEVSFDGSGFSSGLYFYRLTAGSFSDTKRMMLLK